MYRADAAAPGVVELFSTPWANGDPVKLNPPLSPFGQVTGFELSSDGNSVAYGVDMAGFGDAQLYSSPTTGGDPILLTGPALFGVNIPTYQISADSSQVVYASDPALDETFQLLAVPISGGEIRDLSGPLVDGGGLYMGFDRQARFAVSSNGYAVFMAEKDTAGVVELYSVPLAGGEPIKLSDIPVVGGDVQSFLISPDGNYVIFRGDLASNNQFEVWGQKD